MVKGISMPDTSVETDPIAALLAEATPDAAGRLLELSETTPDKEIRKAARRALYQLRQRGVKPAPREAPGTALESSPAVTETLKAYASAYDGAGNRLFLLVVPDPDGGSPTLIQFLINDELGVRQYESRRMPRRTQAAYIERYEQALEHGLAMAEIEADYARWLVAQGREIHQRRGTTTPAGFLDSLPRIGEPGNRYDQSPIYAYYEADEVKSDAALPRDPEALFRLPWFEPWFFAAEEMLPWLVAWEKVEQGVVVVADSVKRERKETILTEAVTGLFPPDTRARYITRLEESADILRRREKTTEAKQALFHALTLSSEIAITEVPFARALTERTMEAAMEMLRAERERQAQQSQAQ
jgi:hypothetical protein